MNIELYNKYGNYNEDGYFIEDFEKWHYYAQRPKLYKKRKIIAYLYLLIPIMGIIPCSLTFEEMGISNF